MSSRKRNKYPSQKKTLSDARRYVIHTGEYNGSAPSSDFMVTGHSTGSPYSEMEELSNQVTRDAGGEPYIEPMFADDQTDTGYELYQGEGLGDLGGPELYGDRYAPKVPSTSRGLMIGAAVGLAATALLGGLAFLVSKSEKKQSGHHRARKAGARTASRSAQAASSSSRSESSSRKSTKSRRGAGAGAGKSTAKSRAQSEESRGSSSAKSRGGSSRSKRSSPQARA